AVAVRNLIVQQPLVVHIQVEIVLGGGLHPLCDVVFQVCVQPGAAAVCLPGGSPRLPALRLWLRGSLLLRLDGGLRLRPRRSAAASAAGEAHRKRSKHCEKLSLFQLIIFPSRKGTRRCPWP